MLIDKTLSKEGYAADAKVVGDKIKIVEDNIETNINKALTEAKESGEFDGPQGETGPSAIYVGVEAPENEDITVWINPEDDDFSDFISTPPTAEVGQTIVVKAVDESGKPTEWEAVDLPSGDSGGGRLLGEITLSEDVNGTIIIPLNDNPFLYGKLLIEMNAQRVDNGDGQYMGTIFGGTKKSSIFHLNTLFSADKTSTVWVMVDLFRDMVHSIATKKGDYMWLANVQYSYAYEIDQAQNAADNMLEISWCSAVSGATFKVWGE